MKTPPFKSSKIPTSDGKSSSLPFFDRLLDFVRTNPDPKRIEEYIVARRDLLNRREITHIGPQDLIPGHRVYDKLSNNILKSVARATSREQLLEEFLEGLDSLGKKSPARCIVVLDLLRHDNEIELQPFAQRRIQSHRWKNFSKNILPSLVDSSFLQAVIINRKPVELWHSLLVPQYAAEFDPIYHTGKEPARRSAYWIAGIPLPAGDAHNPQRGLFVLYPDTGDELRPTLPSGATQEWRALHFLGLAYEMLNHQLAAVAEQVYARRNELLTNLAPGILHHEIGMQMGLIKGLLDEQNYVVRRLCDRYQDDEIKLLLKTLVALYTAQERLFRVTDAFNNLERRQAMQVFDLEKIFSETHLVTYNRLGSVGADFVWPKESKRIKLTSDPALLLHLFVNLVVNAVNSFKSAELSANDSNCTSKTTSRRITTKLKVNRSTDSDCPLSIDTFNNGPEIPPRDRERIFEKGFTTRPEGHGHGLYICRLIAQYLGGTLELINSVELPDNQNVGFRLELPLSMPRYRDMISDRESLPKR